MIDISYILMLHKYIIYVIQNSLFFILFRVYVMIFIYLLKIAQHMNKVGLIGIKLSINLESPTLLIRSPLRNTY